MPSTSRIREIPYNYTSFSDREIVLRFLGAEAWETLNSLRTKRRTGISARMLFEVLGDLWVVYRNPYIQDDLLGNTRRLKALIGAMHHRLDQIVRRAHDYPPPLKLAAQARRAISEFEAWFASTRKRRKQARKSFSRYTHHGNIRFDGLSRIAHATDATDWRVELPFVILTPDHESEIPGLVSAAIELGLSVIPRGGGTGYSGGGVPLTPNCVLINTEKLENLYAVEEQVLPGLDRPVPVVRAGAGVITRRVAERAAAHGLVFAVDPTSQDASTIGGNVAMNAGGKKAVLWGTCLDNLASWRMVTPAADWLEIERLDHNLGRIHEQATVRFRMTRYAPDGITPKGKAEILEFPGSSLRRAGLGKDVTDKFLGGLPGIQKEGCDGIITSATFILHRMPAHQRTVCLEFFGTDLREAVPAIVEIVAAIRRDPAVHLAGLEHLDERYVRAVDYSPKGSRGKRPKMVLLADLAADEASACAAAASRMVRLAARRNADGFIAASPEARKSFWADRARTAAISRHTNAFKINEDVVIPLARLGEYSTAIEHINITQSLGNKIRMLDEISGYLRGNFPEINFRSDYIGRGNYAASAESEAILHAKQQRALDHIAGVRARWYALLQAVARPASPGGGNNPVLQQFLRHETRASYHEEVQKRLHEIFDGRDFEPVCRRFEEIHRRVLSSRLVVALHMHAGDGNVHTNIPVNSNDYEMMHEAGRIVEQVMALACRLGGVISGEHGIGITKIRYLDPTAIARFAEYKHRVDPRGHFNPGKLLPGSGLDRAYTPSLRLVEQEAIILEQSALGSLNDDIKNCLRCGKCKPVCTTQVPRANLYYSPRDKILATGLIIEAFLYEEQTRRGISLHHFEEMNDIADHCTICHRCLTPCPVNIDFGNVTSRMRAILIECGHRHTPLATRASMAFLNARDPRTIALMHKALIEWGFAMQRGASHIVRTLHLADEGRTDGKIQHRPRNTTGMRPVPTRLVHALNKPLPSKVPRQTSRALLGLEDDKMVPILRDPAKVEDRSEAVFYFPGCGSERLYSQIAMATLAMLYHAGTQTVLPPGYLCCGYPQDAEGNTARSRQITTANRILFHRVANTLNYLDIGTVIVSCGTCMDQLLQYQFERIFPGCRLLDIHEYLMEKGYELKGGPGKHYLYHEPCHTPMKTYAGTLVASRLMGQEVPLNDRCCGEAGTFGVSRPDIATQVRYRKEEEIRRGIEQLTGRTIAEKGKVKLLTSCPACLQGLSRYRKDTGVEAAYIVIELARQMFGERWEQTFIERIRNGGIEQVLL